jgi:hypothetical protein
MPAARARDAPGTGNRRAVSNPGAGRNPHRAPTEPPSADLLPILRAASERGLH